MQGPTHGPTHGPTPPTPGARASNLSPRPDATSNFASPAHTPTNTPARTPEARIEAVYDRAANALFRFFLVRLNNDHHAASDLMQQLWLAAVRNARAVPEHELEFWLRSVSRRLLASHWRAHGRALRFRFGHQPSPDPTAPTAPQAAARDVARSLADQFGTRHLPPAILEHDETRKLVLLALTDLPADDQQLIIEHYFRGVPHADLAERTGSSPRAIEGRLYRARQTLKLRLAALASSD